MSAPNYVQPWLRQSRRGLWTTLGIVGGVLVIGLLAFGVLVTTGVIVGLSAFFHTTNQPVPVAAHYYLSILGQDYTGAYSDLDAHATIHGQQVTQQSFTTLASAADAHNGRVTGYTIDQGTDPARLTITVHRGARTYQVHLQLQQKNSVWKIISADGI